MKVWASFFLWKVSSFKQRTAWARGVHKVLAECLSDVCGVPVCCLSQDRSSDASHSPTGQKSEGLPSSDPFVKILEGMTSAHLG